MEPSSRQNILKPASMTEGSQNKQDGDRKVAHINIVKSTMKSIERKNKRKTITIFAFL